MFINSDSQYAKKNLKNLRRNTGIPLGPVDFDESNESMIVTISSGTVGLKKRVLPFGLIIAFPLASRLTK